MYEGTFQNGKAEDKGYFVDSKHGFVYIGQWKDDKIEGFGKLT